MIVKLIFLGIFVWLGLRIYKAIKAAKKPEITQDVHQDMVCCQHCNIHIPVNEAIIKEGKYYCSPEHLPNKP